MQNLPECSIQRRHYITELKYKQEADKARHSDNSEWLSNFVIAFSVFLLVVILI